MSLKVVVHPLGPDRPFTLPYQHVPFQVHSRKRPTYLLGCCLPFLFFQSIEIAKNYRRIRLHLQQQFTFGRSLRNIYLPLLISCQGDDKLIALTLQMNGYLMTNDYPLGKVAESQGVTVLNINLLANAVRSMYVPGETFALRVIQEGRDSGQGVGYLDDGTMVVVEGGRRYMDRTVKVTVTKLINRDAGRMIFAIPENQ